MTDVCVLAGGLSPERDISLKSGRRIADALRHAGYDVTVRDTDAELLPAWDILPPDIVIPLLHGDVGEDGSLRDILETLHIPYLGAEPAACRVTFDKPIAKSFIRQWGGRTADWIALPHSAFRELGANRIMEAAVTRLGLPIVVKPARGGSALGLSIVEDAAQLPPAMVGAFAYSDTVLLESFVSGVEVAVSVVDRDGEAQALPSVEIVSDSGIYDYQARYTAGMTEFFCPARLEPEIEENAQELALLAHRRFGVRDFSRTDMIIDNEGHAHFLELNVAPGMTETSLFPQSAQAAGLSLSEILAQLITRRLADPRTEARQ